MIMKRLLKFTLLFFLLSKNFGVSANESKDFDEYFKILPRPQRIELLSGDSFLYNDLRFLHLEGFNKIPVINYPICSLPLTDFRGKGSTDIDTFPKY